MRPQRNADAVEHAMPSPDAFGCDGYSGIVVGLVHDAVWILLRLPPIGIERLRIGLVAGENLIDGDGFARLRLRKKLVIVVSPPGGDAAAALETKTRAASVESNDTWSRVWSVVTILT